MQIMQNPNYNRCLFFFLLKANCVTTWLQMKHSGRDKAMPWKSHSIYQYLSKSVWRKYLLCGSHVSAGRWQTERRFCQLLFISAAPIASFTRSFIPPSPTPCIPIIPHSMHPTVRQTAWLVQSRSMEMNLKEGSMLGLAQSKNIHVFTQRTTRYL